MTEDPLAGLAVIIVMIFAFSIAWLLVGNETCKPTVSNLVESHTVTCYNGSVMRIEDNLVFCDCAE